MDQKSIDALRKYNSKWSGIDAPITRKLYGLATAHKSAQYGCNLQDIALEALGMASTDVKIDNRDIDQTAQQWLDWMKE